MDCRIRVITWEAFQDGIAPLWKAEADPRSIPIVNNPYQIIEYPFGEWRDRICFFPCEAVNAAGDVIGYTSIYNISDRLTRIRGIYVLPEHQGRGYGHEMWQQATKLFPRSFHRTVGFWRESSYERFIQHSGMTIIPERNWLWSAFSGVRMKMLYRDHRCAPNAAEVMMNQDFLARNVEEFGFGGTNNLNRSWTDDDWEDFAGPEETAYEPLGVDLNFP